MADLPPPIILSADAVPARFVEAVSKSHRMEVLVQVLDSETGQVLRTLDKVESGAVVQDGSAAIRGRVEMDVIDDPDESLVPILKTDDLRPEQANEIRVCRGVRYPDNTAEVVSLGKFRIRKVAATDAGGGTVLKITAQDRWCLIVDARFEEPWVIAPATNFVDGMLATVQEAYPEVEHDLGATTLVTPADPKVGETGADRGEFLQEMAGSLGHELYFDGNGVLRREPIANFGAEEQWEIGEGENGLLLEAQKEWDVERLYNRVIATGESVDDVPPVRGVATDDNPDSPTYYYGPFGHRPRFYVSSFITTEAQAIDAATGILWASLGTSQRVDFGAVVNPAITVSSLVRITREQLGISDLHFLDSVTIPLSADQSMTGTTRIFELGDE